MYHLPLLPGYGPGINVRSSAAPAAIPTPTAEDIIAPVSESVGEATTYEETYLSSSAPTRLEGFSPGTSPNADIAYTTDTDTPKLAPVELTVASAPPQRRPSPPHDPDTFGEAVFFQYGVVVFFGLDASQEDSILEDIEGAGTMIKPLKEENWEVEECHYEVCECLLSIQIMLSYTLHSTSLTSRTLVFSTTSSVSLSHSSLEQTDRP